MFGEKSGWEYLQLAGTLAIPGVIAFGTLWFTGQQNEQQRLIEERRAQADRELEDQRAQDAALQAYLDQMSTLLLEEDLRNSAADSEVGTLARARTVTVIQRLNADGNQNVIRFLSEAKLTGGITGQSSISLLTQADLQGAHFEGVDLSAIDLSDADLSDAYLSNANMESADLSGADLSNADLSGEADLKKADLSGADLSNADLSGDADLEKADLSDAYLSDANLIDAYMVRADLSGADLSSANLASAELAFSDLSDANLSLTNLLATSLIEANLRGAVGLYEGQLAQALCLEGATMPNGQKYEDWIKSKGRGEGGENGCPS